MVANKLERNKLIKVMIYLLYKFYVIKLIKHITIKYKNEEGFSSINV